MPFGKVQFRQNNVHLGQVDGMYKVCSCFITVCFMRLFMIFLGLSGVLVAETEHMHFRAHVQTAFGDDDPCDDEEVGDNPDDEIDFDDFYYHHDRLNEVTEDSALDTWPGKREDPFFDYYTN